MNMLNSAPAGRASNKSSTRRHNKPKWQTHVISSLFLITLLLVFGFFAQEGLRWLS
ncbi:hypothetical protein L4D76_15895 [Photobacterium sagamiensis]|uniref:hypothetical protein n=1 Tax=Photobacterium sagamiensis TaxID=2910241 RepID=UPI003D14B40D